MKSLRFKFQVSGFRFQFALVLCLMVAASSALLVQPVSAQSTNFFSSTSRVGQVEGTGCSPCPGFNPTLGLLKHTDIAQCPTDTCAAPYFDRLGSGTITDNMFGVISGASREIGPDGLLGTVDDTFTKCGTAPVSPTTLFSTLAGLNCGNLRHDPASQGMTPPTDPNTMAQVGGNTGMNADFSPAADPHQGILLENNFQWRNPSTNSCGASGPPPGPPSPTPCTTAAFHLDQVGAILPGQSGFLLAPGSGEQAVDFRASWSTNNTSPTAFDPPIVTWSQNFSEPSSSFFNPSPDTPAVSLPCQTPAGMTPFMVQCGSFTYNQDQTFPTVHYPLGEKQSSLVQGTIP
jgi:hypothetical protein